ncbi:unnamed protein product, partial [Allacma fusca]
HTVSPTKLVKAETVAVVSCNCKLKI